MSGTIKHQPLRISYFEAHLEWRRWPAWWRPTAAPIFAVSGTVHYGNALEALANECSAQRLNITRRWRRGPITSTLLGKRLAREPRWRWARGTRREIKLRVTWTRYPRESIAAVLKMTVDFAPPPEPATERSHKQ